MKSLIRVVCELVVIFFAIEVLGLWYGFLVIGIGALIGGFVKAAAEDLDASRRSR